MPRPRKSSAPKTTTGPTPVKRDFIMKFGLDKPTSSIVAAAKQAGIRLTSSYVYELRKRANKGGEAPSATAAAKRGPARPKTTTVAAAAPSAPRGRPGRKPKAAAPVTATRSHGGVESAFRAAAGEIVIAHGVGHAQALLDEVSAKIRAILG